MSGQVTKWYVPAISDTDLVHEFVTGNSGGIITRQCFKQDVSTGKYLIDTTKITETAGFELLDTTLIDVVRDGDLITYVCSILHSLTSTKTLTVVELGSQSQTKRNNIWKAKSDR